MDQILNAKLLLVPNRFGTRQFKMFDKLRKHSVSIKIDIDCRVQAFSLWPPAANVVSLKFCDIVKNLICSLEKFLVSAGCSLHLCNL